MPTGKLKRLFFRELNSIVYFDRYKFRLPVLLLIQFMAGLEGVDGTICSETGIGIQDAGEIQGEAEGVRLVDQATGGFVGWAESSVETGMLWFWICYVLVSLIGKVLIKHPWSLTFKGFYVDYQPWITMIYLAILAGSVVGYPFC